VECYTKNTQHPAFHKAMFVGNDSGTTNYTVTLGPGPNGTACVTSTDNLQHTVVGNWDTVAKTTDKDYVDGDIYVDGSLDITGGTDVFGTVDTTGSDSDGSTVTGT